jgi:hypothetical protein
MSLIHTESFMGIDPVDISVVGDNYVAAPGNYRVAYAAQLRQTSYDVVISDQLAQERTGGFMVRPDPVVASRNALVFGSGSGTPSVSNAYQMQAAIRKVIGSYDKPIIFGFSLFIPPEYVAVPGDTATMLRILAGPVGDTSWSTAGAANTIDVFNIMRSLQCRWYTDAAQSSKTLVAGKQNYLEVRIADGEIKVWLDDVLVVQKSWSLSPEYVAFQFVHSNTTSMSSWLAGAPGRWAISNFYILTEDAVAPNARLGPSTRVIGQRATRDIAANFLKPDAAPSNASIAAQGIGGVRTGTLQTARIGDSDIYAADQTTQNDTITSSKVIHGVVSRVSAQNLDGIAHTIRPTVFSPQLDEGNMATKPRSIAYIGNIGPDRSDGWGNTITGIAVRPTDKKIFAVGCSFSILTNTNNGQGPWTQTDAIAFDDAKVNWKIAFAPNGAGVIVRSDGKIGYLPPGADKPSVLVTPPGQPASNVLKCVLYHPDGYWVISGGTGTAGGTDYFATTTTPDIAASWTYYTGGGHDIGLAYNKTTKRILTTNIVAGTLYYSDDIRTSAGWKPTPTPTAATVYRAVTWNGSYFFAVGNSDIASSNMIYSTDALAWTAATTIGQQGTGISQMVFAESDPTTGFMIMGGANGAIYTSQGNPAQWRPFTKITGYNAKLNAYYVPMLQCAGQMPNGDWLIVGDGGIAVLLSPAGADRPIPNGSGYVTVACASTINPTTGAPWTPSQAALADFGARITS